MAAYKTGHIPDHPEVVKRRLGLHLSPFMGVLMLAAAQLPMETTNRAKMPPEKGGPGILNQSDTSSCEGHAHGSGGTLFFANQGYSQGLLSPVQLYLGALLMDQTLNADGTLTAATDTGTMPSSILLAWFRFGALLAKDDQQFPATSATLYKNPNDPNSVLLIPPMEELEADSPYRYLGAYFVVSQGPQRLLDVLSTLASGRPITDAIPASGQDFQGYSGGILGALSGPTDHANLIVDYKWLGTAADWQTFTTALKQGATSIVASLSQYLIFICVNSWGTPWGEGDAVSTMSGGMYRADTNYLAQAEDLCVLDLSLAA